MKCAPIHLHIDTLVLEGLPTGPGYAAQFASELQAAVIEQLSAARSSSGHDADGPIRSGPPTATLSPASVAAAVVGAAVAHLPAPDVARPAATPTSPPAVVGHRPGGRGGRP